MAINHDREPIAPKLVTAITENEETIHPICLARELGITQAWVIPSKTLLGLPLWKTIAVSWAKGSRLTQGSWPDHLPSPIDIEVRQPRISGLNRR